MAAKDPFEIIKHEHVTEKANTLRRLETSESNPSVRACKTPKYVFIVHSKATKREIAGAVESIYKDLGIKVISVNTINVKPKATLRRNRRGSKPGFKKAIVTLEQGHALEEQ